MSLQVTLIASLVSGAVAFTAGIKWERANQVDAMKVQIAALSEQAQTALDDLSSKWKEEAAQAQIDVNEWNLQNQSDMSLLQELLRGQDDIRDKFDELGNEITITTDFGTCELSPAAVELLRNASRSAATGDGEAGD